MCGKISIFKEKERGSVMPILSVQNILLRFGGPPLLDNVSFDIEAGDRICLVGRNGEGKSTLLKVLTGEMETNSGEIVKKSGLRVSRMIQEIPAHLDGTVRDIVMGRVSVVSGGSVISKKILDDGAHNAMPAASALAHGGISGAGAGNRICVGRAGCGRVLALRGGLDIAVIGAVAIPRRAESVGALVAFGLRVPAPGIVRKLANLNRIPL